MPVKLVEMTNEKLWELFPIIIEEYNDEWPKLYVREEKLLLEYVGEKSILFIDHIGSTAVRGLPAKPIIDVMIQISDDADLDELISFMESAGYIYVAQPDNPPPHMVFYKGYTERGFEGQAYHVHIRYEGDWDELVFRDYLRENTDVSEEYGELKITLMERYRNDRDGYTNAKTDFVQRVVKKARKSMK